MNELTLKKNINDVIVAISLKQIKNEKEYQITGEWLKRVKETEKMVDSYFEPIKKEKYAEYKAVLNKIKEMRKPLEKVEAVVKNMRIEYKKKIEEQMRKQKEEMLKGLNEEDKAIVKDIIPNKIDEVEGVSHKTIWDFEIVDESKIPREYLMPDEKKIGKVVRAMKDKTNIPGVKVKKVVIEAVTV